MYISSVARKVVHIQVEESVSSTATYMPHQYLTEYECVTIEMMKNTSKELQRLHMEYNRKIDITECSEVYPPAEDTFLLLDSLEVSKGLKVLEMGCGTGLISCHMAFNGAVLTAADINPKAVNCTSNNLKNNNLEGNTVVSDLFQNIYEIFDLIVFNPPYLSAEEEGCGIIEKAWAGGPTGTEILAKFLEQCREHLLPNGRITILLSSEMDLETLDRLLSKFNRKKLKTRRCFFEELWVEELRLQ